MRTFKLEFSEQELRDLHRVMNLATLTACRNAMTAEEGTIDAVHAGENADRLLAVMDVIEPVINALNIEEWTDEVKHA